MIDITNIDVSILKPAEYNPRQANELEYNNLRESIKRFGLVDPIIVNNAPERMNNVIGGHFRLKVATELGIKQVPVVYVNIPEEERERELNLRLNKNLGEWDIGALANFDENMLKDVGFTSEELDKIFQLDMKSDPDSVPEVKDEEVGVRAGDLYQLGTHRLLCGDSTQKEAVERLMGGLKADMVFTDPPYGIKAVKNNMVGADFGVAAKGRYNSIIGDDEIKDVRFLLTLSSKVVIWGGNYFATQLPTSGSWIVWDKRGDTGIRNTFADCELAWSNSGQPARVYKQLWNGMIREGEKDKRVHPTQKPIDLLANILTDITGREDLVLDLFGGSGSTMIACERLNRKCYMMEIDPKYCQVIINRWEQYTNSKAQQIN